MTTPTPHKMVIITNFKREVLYANDEYCQLHNRQPIDIFNKKTSSFTDFPLGVTKVYEDFDNFQENTSSEVNRPVIIVTPNAFLLGTLRKKPLLESSQAIGAINEIDLSLAQIAHNPIFHNLKKYSFQCEEFSPLDLKMLILLAQCKNIKSSKIAEILGVKSHTAYVYKHNLLSKLNISLEKNTHRRDFFQSVLLDLFYLDTQIDTVTYLPYREVKKMGILKNKVA